MGRSSNSSHYQLSANKLISRVHVAARYIPAYDGNPDKVEITCMGWNGMKVHCHGRSWDLTKGDSFTSATESAEIMLDIQDARVFVGWPEARDASTESEGSWNGDEDDVKSPVKAVNGLGIILPSTNTIRGMRNIRTSVSPSPARPSTGRSINDIFASNKTEVDPNATIQIFEDEDSDNEAPVKDSRDTDPFEDVSASQSGSISENESEDDPNEENDPIIHSFGPFGNNLTGRMAAFNHGTPEPEGSVYEHSSAPSSPSPEKRMKTEPTATKLEAIEEEKVEEDEHPAHDAEPKPYISHAINQLAYSRLQSTPLSVILQHLPKELRGISDEHPENRGLSKSELHRALMATPCIGEIRREGKDAAGKPLESEYYYIPDMDTDEARRATVVDGLRKPSLRACRKQHKVSLPLYPSSSRNPILTCYSNTTGRSHAHHKPSYLQVSVQCERVQTNKIFDFLKKGMLRRWVVELRVEC